MRKLWRSVHRAERASGQELPFFLSACVKEVRSAAVSPVRQGRYFTGNNRRLQTHISLTEDSAQIPWLQANFVSFGYMEIVHKSIKQRLKKPRPCLFA